MKILALFLFVVPCLAVDIVNGPPPPPLVPDGRIQFAWDYPTNELSTNLTFILWKSTDLTNWTQVAAFPGTNTTATFTLAPVGACAFALSASNFWGSTSFFSNFAFVPNPPRNDGGFRGRKAP